MFHKCYFERPKTSTFLGTQRVFNDLVSIVGRDSGHIRYVCTYCSSSSVYSFPDRWVSRLSISILPTGFL